MSGTPYTLRITAPVRDDTRVWVRRSQFSVGRPIELDAESTRVSAMEYALGAVGAEIVGGLQTFARRRRVEIDRVEAVVHADVDNVLTYLEVVGEAGQPKIARIHVKVYVASPAADEVVRALWDATLDRLPLVGTLRAAVRLDIELILTG